MNALLASALSSPACNLSSSETSSFSVKVESSGDGKEEGGVESVGVAGMDDEVSLMLPKSISVGRQLGLAGQDVGRKTPFGSDRRYELEILRGRIIGRIPYFSTRTTSHDSIMRSELVKARNTWH